MPTEGHVEVIKFLSIDFFARNRTFLSGIDVEHMHNQVVSIIRLKNVLLLNKNPMPLFVIPKVCFVNDGFVSRRESLGWKILFKHLHLGD